MKNTKFTVKGVCRIPALNTFLAVADMVLTSHHKFPKRYPVKLTVTKNSDDISILTDMVRLYCESSQYDIHGISNHEYIARKLIAEIRMIQQSFTKSSNRQRRASAFAHALILKNASFKKNKGLIALHDADQTNFPNLALMKLSSFHKLKGDHVEFFDPSKTYDHVYSSSVFTFRADPNILPDNSILGGTGYQSKNTLSDEIEHICPDYSLYDLNYSLGFTTRGCHRSCQHCLVPQKEGAIKEHADLEEFVKHQHVVLMDNNILAHPHGIKQIEKLIKLNLKPDLNQGVDARLIDKQIAHLFSKLTFFKPLRFSCDSLKSLPSVKKAVRLLRHHNVTPRRYFCYVLVQKVDEALEIVMELDAMNVDACLFARNIRILTCKNRINYMPLD